MGSESVNWSGFSEAEPELAQRIRGRFDAHLHHVVGTLDSSGAPRVSGTEVRIVDDDVWLGSMVNSVKVLDLRRDPRCSIHSAPLDAEMKDGDAKLSGLAVEVTDPVDHRVLPRRGRSSGRTLAGGVVHLADHQGGAHLGGR
ncbi:MAG: hypothetical protein V9G14_10430 [Cypionkella sp.]